MGPGVVLNTNGQIPTLPQPACELELRSNGRKSVLCNELRGNDILQSRPFVQPKGHYFCTDFAKAIRLFILLVVPRGRDWY